MPDTNDPKKTQQVTQKVVALKDDPVYANCSLVETTPFDISILFGRVRPKTDEAGNRELVEVYEKQVYLSHLQAKALYEALGRSLDALKRQKSEPEKKGPQPETRPRLETKTRPDSTPKPAATPKVVPKAQPVKRPSAEGRLRDVKNESDPKPTKQ